MSMTPEERAECGCNDEPGHDWRCRCSCHREAAIVKAVAEEREACAALAMGITGPSNTVAQSAGYSGACREIAAAIRARGQR